MTIFSKLKTTIGNNHNSNPEDILQTRKHFKEIGIEAGEEDRPLIDKPLDNAVRVFQRELGLKEDRIMKPKGETEEALNLALKVKEKLPPLPPQEPEAKKETRIGYPPIPQRKGDAIAKIKGKDKAKKAGDLASELFLGRLGRIPIKNKVIKQIIKSTVGKGREPLSEGIEKLFEKHFIKTELEREETQRNKRIN